jgi:hypothetical protein
MTQKKDIAYSDNPPSNPLGALQGKIYKEKP